jgi:hypothetical protein
MAGARNAADIEQRAAATAWPALVAASRRQHVCGSGAAAANWGSQNEVGRGSVLQNLPSMCSSGQKSQNDSEEGSCGGHLKADLTQPVGGTSPTFSFGERLRYNGQRLWQTRP